MIICGIYKITSPIGKVYIGQSVDIQNRWESYGRMDSSSQRLLFKSFFEYGFRNHTFEVIHQLPVDIDPFTLNVYEETYIQLHRDANIELLNQQFLVRRYVDKYKKVYQYSLEGEFLKEWNSSREAARGLGLKSHKNIRSVASGFSKSAHGFIWQNYHTPRLTQYKYKEFIIKINYGN